jgi:putative chitobiose transport system permease protein
MALPHKETMPDRRPIFLKIVIWTTAALLVLLAIGPAFWLVATSFSTTEVPLHSLPRPGQLTDDNYKGVMGIRPGARVGDEVTPAEGWLEGLARLWREGTLLTQTPLRPFLNSVIVTLVQTLLNVLLASLAAYPLARMNFRGRDTIFVIILATLMIPDQVLVVPLFRTIVHMGLYDTLAAVFIPFSVSAFGIFLCRQAFLSIPKELEEAAQIDGASALHVWWHVMVPLAAPALATLAVFTIIGSWSALLWPLIVLQSPQNMTLPVRISELLSIFATNIRWAYAGSVMALVPMVLMYIVMQRWLQRGLLAGAVKG